MLESKVPFSAKSGFAILKGLFLHRQDSFNALAQQTSGGLNVTGMFQIHVSDGIGAHSAFNGTESTVENPAPISTRGVQMIIPAAIVASAQAFPAKEGGESLTKCSSPTEAAGFAAVNDAQEPPKPKEPFPGTNAGGHHCAAPVVPAAPTKYNVKPPECGPTTAYDDVLVYAEKINGGNYENVETLFATEWNDLVKR